MGVLTRLTPVQDPYIQSCQAGEVNITIVGVDGAICSPACGVLDSCPKDIPKGATAKPTCALQVKHKKPNTHNCMKKNGWLKTNDGILLSRDGGPVVTDVIFLDIFEA